MPDILLPNNAVMKGRARERYYLIRRYIRHCRWISQAQGMMQATARGLELWPIQERLQELGVNPEAW